MGFMGIGSKIRYRPGSNCNVFKTYIALEDVSAVSRAEYSGQLEICASPTCMLSLYRKQFCTESTLLSVTGSAFITDLQLAVNRIRASLFFSICSGGECLARCDKSALNRSRAFKCSPFASDTFWNLAAVTWEKNLGNKLIK